jgi:hypothetical protein
MPIEKDSVALCAISDADKIVIAFDRENRVTVYDTTNRRIHEWSRKNQVMPDNYGNRFNRISGIVKISDTKYILYTNYTYIVLDLTQDLHIDH